MHSPIPLFAASWIAGTLFSAAGQDLPKPTALQSIARILSLPRSEAAKLHRVLVAGTVTFHSRDLFFLQDRTGGIFVYFEPPLATNLTGQRVLIAGLTGKGRLANIIWKPKVQRLGKGRFPSPVELDYRDLIQGRHDSQWSAAEGVIASQRHEGDRLWLELLMTGGRAKLLMPWDHARGIAPNLSPTTRVRFEGVAAVTVNDSGNIIDAYFAVPTEDAIHITHPGLEAPFSAPARTIASLKPHAGHGVQESPAVIQGVCLSKIPGQGCVLQDPTGTVPVYTYQDEDVAVGDRIKAAGFPSIQKRSLVMDRALIEVTGRSSLPQAVSISSGKIQGGELDWNLVELEGRLIDLRPHDGGLDLVISGRDILATAHLHPAPRLALPTDCQPLATLRTRGILLPASHPEGGKRSAEILLRNPLDVTVIAPAPWWTAQRAKNAFLLMGLFILAGMAWGFTLRRKVQRQAGLIRDQLSREYSIQRTYQDLFENAHDAIFTVDLEGRFVSVNPAAQRITGYTKTEWRQRRLEGLVAPGQCLGIPQLEAAATAKKKITAIFQTKAGNHVPLELTSRFMEKDGRPAGIQAIARDVSDRIRHEKELLRAKLIAEAGSKAKGDFLADMSHEIRTPMNGILGMAELALTTDLDQEQRELIQTIQESAKSLSAILDGILDLSKIESGKMELDIAERPLEKTLRHTVQSFDPAAREKHIRLTLIVGPEVPRLVATDDLKLRQILANLLSNAIKFTARGRITVEVTWEAATEKTGLRLPNQSGFQPHSEAGCGVLKVTIADTGIGIPHEKQGDIFHAFTQADSSVTRRYGGTGLGLAICARLVQLLGGVMHLDSAPGRGSRFSFSILAWGRTPRPEKSPAVPSDHPASGPLHPNHPRLTILVAEDSEINRKVTRAMLRRLGHTVDLVSNGALAVRAWAKGEYDLILMDIQMPELDGVQATKKIRETEVSKGTYTPVIALTAHAMKPQQEACIAAGMDAHLSKPVRAHDLAEMIERAAGLKRPKTSG